MYSGTIIQKKEYTILTVSYNGNNVINFTHTFQEPKSMMVYFTLEHYKKIEANNMVDPMQNVIANIAEHHPFILPWANKIPSEKADNAKYMSWLKNYLEVICGQPINEITVYQRMVHFNSNGTVTEDSNKILYVIH